jgi:class 3 adenylate cyclase/tetratricopeptide (TPR) repeat protein
MMKCPKCQFENPDEALFCAQCGDAIEFHCPNCGAITLATGKFCIKCGHNLTAHSEPAPKELSFEEKLEKIQRYLPKGLAEKILAQRDKIEGERKQVTVMFCDMEGFTSLTERLGPEEAYSIMDQVYEILIHKVSDYEGTVNEMTGDGIMALFGAPIALEDAPQRAIRSAMAIHREILKFSDKIKRERQGIPTLKMRIGIHTGPVVVGTLGNDLRVEFKAVGDTVNLASRMEKLAEPGTTYVTGDTLKVTEGLFRFEALGEKQVKGKEEPVNVFQVIAPSTRRTRFDVNAERGLTPFVGRERELELLLDGFERAKAGRGQAFSIMSEAGGGKSRLLYEFRKSVASEDITFLEGRCLSYSRGIAYHPVIDILKSNFDIQEGDGDLVVKEKVKTGLRIIGADEVSTLPYLLELLSVKDSGIDTIPMSPEGRKDRILEALKRIVLKGSEIRPLIMAIEDLHWIDKGSEDSLKDLFENISGANVFLIFTYRPEFVHTWGGKSYHSQVNLNRLSNRESLTMLSYLLGTEDIDKNLADLVLEKTEGIPFFVEEFVKSLKDLKIIEKKNSKYHLAKDILEMIVPSTIQDVIMARVDSLPDGAKEVLQIGSVIEREFSYELVRRLTGLPEQELLSRLSCLKDSELLYERGIYPETTYIFKNALTCEVVYDSILTIKKKKLHEEIGNAIEKLHGKNIEENYGILCEHFVKSENYEKGARYSKLASKKAEKTASLNDAIAYAEKRIACLEKLPQTDDVKKGVIDARTVLGLYMSQMNYFVEAREAIDSIVDLALSIGYKRRLSQIYTILGAYNIFVEEAFSEGFGQLEESLKISEEVGDVVSSFFASFWLEFALTFSCEFEKSLYYGEKALNINVAANSPWGIASTKSMIAQHVYYNHGKIDMSDQTSTEAMRLAEESGDIYSKALAYGSQGASCYGKRSLEEAIKHLLKGAEFCEKISFFSWNSAIQQLLAESYFEAGQYQKSEDHYEKAVWLIGHNRWLPSWMNFMKIGIARAKIMNNEENINLEPLYRYSNENKLKLCEGPILRYIGEILLNIDDHHMSKAEDWIKKAIEADRTNEVMFSLGQDYALYAELIKRKGDRVKAKENLSKGIEIYRECGADGWVKKAEEETATLS